MKVVAILPAAGRGERLGSPVPKALVEVRGVSLLARAVGGLLDSGVVDAVVVAAPHDYYDEFVRVLAPLEGQCEVVGGGHDRSSSVRFALDSVPPGAYDVVLVHDAARAFAPGEVTRAVVDAVRDGAAAAVPVLPVTDTVKVVDDAGVIITTQDRSALRAVQTPQGFTDAVLRAAYAAGFDSATDDAGLVEQLGEQVRTVAGHPDAMKITTAFDLAVAEAVLAPKEEA
ncbi:MAG: 2-C-methyl-D-erythritol 4-phosphate cytidylyltransferase [Actinophytocola sp.]|nr:2-C-methyl-D-erythritol 4-phosphate cytidylyltransferase [Actinophytocola sp.]